MDLPQAAKQLADHAIKARRLAPLTLDAYSGDISAFTNWRVKNGLSLDVEAVRSAEIEAYIADSCDISPATIRRRVDALSSLYKFLGKRGLAEVNPTAQVDRPRAPDSERPYLTDEQMAKLFAVVAGTQERAVLLLLCLLGLRRSEVVSLDCGDVDLATGRLEIRRSKGGRSRTLPIPSELTPTLRDQLDCRAGSPADPLFLSYHKNRLSRSAVGRLFHKWLRLAGLEGLGLSPHSCRHGCATRCLRAGLSLVQVQRLLGHRSVETTGRYCHAALDEIAADLESKVPPVGEGPTQQFPSALSPEWQQALQDLTPDQRHALLALAKSIARGEPVRGP